MSSANILNSCNIYAAVIFLVPNCIDNWVLKYRILVTCLCFTVDVIVEVFHSAISCILFCFSPLVFLLIICGN
jgi:hypothetical protein